MVCRLLFNENRGSRVTDVCNNIKDAQLVGNYNWINTKYGGSVHLLGTDDYINIGKSLQPFVDYDRPHSCCFWIAIPTTGTAWKDVCSVAYNNGGSWEYFEFPRYIDNKFHYIVLLQQNPGSQGFQDYMTNVPGFVNGKIHFCAVTYGGYAGSTQWYFDGVAVPTTHGVLSADLNKSFWQSGRMGSLDWIIGGSRQVSAIASDMEMHMAQWMIHKRVLSKSEIAMLHDNPYAGMQVRTKHIYPYFASDWAPTDPFGMLGIHGI